MVSLTPISINSSSFGSIKLTVIGPEQKFSTSPENLSVYVSREGQSLTLMMRFNLYQRHPHQGHQDLRSCLYPLVSLWPQMCAQPAARLVHHGARATVAIPVVYQQLPSKEFGSLTNAKLPLPESIENVPTFRHNPPKAWARFDLVLFGLQL
ncbi:unnamed protein product [Nesidiocoris tenuis]|uniref:Uncharacterized protein n=1 Tax=Nesidiocoris tenuis TaxID=355587 RepID=A0A6H5GZI9_9HEMI|nr:unnamed protein product [Nesidiocoris tenuis]